MRCKCAKREEINNKDLWDKKRKKKEKKKKSANIILYLKNNGGIIILIFCNPKLHSFDVISDRCLYKVWL